MNPVARAQLDALRQHLRSASLATAGGFRPPQDPLTSWFGRAVGLPHETLPEFEGKPMFPLLQIRVAGLPCVPGQLRDVALLVLFHNQSRHPFDLPHGEGWLIRERQGRRLSVRNRTRRRPSRRCVPGRLGREGRLDVGRQWRRLLLPRAGWPVALGLPVLLALT
ncbi:hypothetical protein [Massilia genomosp. 1]|uniref:hypothetical protein n=1 Tax=Massilia genomosp. 1 TaxID=2609280 RepID=UPI001C9E50E3|nr:hypothetical protein [Massilia genomosp. 1]